jgi:hypothetical protein
VSAYLSRRGFLKGLLTAAVAAPVIYSFPKILVPQNIGLIGMIDYGTYVNQYLPCSRAAWARALQFEMDRFKESFFEHFNYNGPTEWIEQDGSVLRREEDGTYSAFLRGEHYTSGLKAGETAWGRLVVSMPSVRVPSV